MRAPRGDIDLAFCRTCGMIFNASFRASLMGYDVPYENALHHSPRFQQYAEELSRHLLTTYNLKDKVALEIGSGDGHFLQLLLDGGMSRGIGFDPSHEPVERDDSMPITLLQDYFRSSLVPRPIHLACCRHVLEHIAEPHEFLAEIKSLVSGFATEMIIYFEVPDTRYSLEHGGIWDILYEHFTYFTPPSLKRLFRDAGFRVLNERTAYEGQFLSIEASTKQTRNSLPDASNSDREQLARHVDDFARQYEAKLMRWNRELELIGQKKQRAALWGAGTKGVMFLNSVEGADHIGRVVDLNPRKHGSFVAGAGHRITSPESLAEWKPDIVLVMNPVYREEIAASFGRLGIRPDLRIV